MKMRFSTFLYLTIRILWIAVFLAPTSLLSPRYPARAQTTDTEWALQFDGTSDNVKLARTADIFESGWESTKSVNLWVKPMKPPGENNCDNWVPGTCDTILGDRPRSWGISIGRIPWGPFAEQDRIWVWNVDENLGDIRMDFIGIPYILNKWVNIALVHDGGMLRAYKNGVLVGSSPSGVSFQIPGNHPVLYLGGIIAGPEDIRTFGGQIDEVHIWNVALSAAEIIDQMYQTTITDTLGLRAYYKVSDSPPDPEILPPMPLFLTDDSGNGWNGTFLDGGPDVEGDGHYAQWVEREIFEPPHPPDKPSNLTVSAASLFQLFQSWSDNSETEFSFEIERCSGVGCSDFSLLETILDSPGIGPVNYEDTQVSIGTSYCYRVRAANTGGKSDYSNVDCATVPVPVFLPLVIRR